MPMEITANFSEEEKLKIEEVEIDTLEVSGGSGGESEPIGALEVEESEDENDDYTSIWTGDAAIQPSSFQKPRWLGGEHPNEIDLKQKIKEEYSVDNRYLDGVVETLYDEWGSYSGEEIETATEVMVSNDIHPDALDVVKILSEHELQTIKKNGVLINDIDGALIIEDKRGTKEIPQEERQSLDDVIYGSSQMKDTIDGFGSGGAGGGKIIKRKRNEYTRTLTGNGGATGDRNNTYGDGNSKTMKNSLYGRMIY